MDILGVIEGALSIKDLWLPCNKVKEEHEGEAKALNEMYKNFVDVLKIKSVRTYYVKYKLSNGVECERHVSCEIIFNKKDFEKLIEYEEGLPAKITEIKLTSIKFL